MKTARAHLPLLLGLGLLAGGVGLAQMPARADLGQMNIEELMNIHVTSVSKKQEKLAESPAAIYVITQEEIRRSGLTSIPEILRMVPGLDIAQVQSNQWAVSARGFNAQFSNKLLVLLDGRSVYLPSDAGVAWDQQDTLLEDIDRIEVIRGPGAAMWGANAVNGVINIITKSASDTQGGLITATTGDRDRAVQGIRYGGRIAKLGSYRVYSKYSRRRTLTESDDDPNADWAVIRSGFRTDWRLSGRDSLTIQGDLFRSTAGIDLTLPLLTSPFLQSNETTERASGGNLLANWSHRTSDRSVVTVKAYFDHMEKSSLLLGEKYNTFDLDFQHTLTLSPRHEIVWGLGYRRNASAFRSSPTLSFKDSEISLYSAFVQDEVHLVPEQLSIILGSRIERNEFIGTEAQPTARLLWTPNARHAVWTAVSRAVRTPSYFEVGSTLNLQAFPGDNGIANLLTMNGSPQAAAEVLLAYEVGYRAQLGDRLSFDWTGFYNSYHHLSTYEPATPFLASAPAPLHLVMPFYSDNRMRGESQGVEIAGTWDVAKFWRIRSSYSWLNLQLHLDQSSRNLIRDAVEGQSPQHQAQFRSELDLSHKLQFDTSLYYVGSLPTLSVPAYARVDARLGWRPRAPLEISAVGQNLQGGKHVEYVSEGPFGVSRIGPSVYAKVTWQF
jgi:iron complex outermembrane receptor protein